MEKIREDSPVYPGKKPEGWKIIIRQSPTTLLIFLRREMREYLAAIDEELKNREKG
jgi:hypothetical protein